MPILEMSLRAGEAMVAEGGDVAWLSPGFHMDTSTAHGGGGGFMGGLKRMLGGGQLFLTKYTAASDGDQLAFAAKLPGSIREMAIDSVHGYMIQTGAFMASSPGVEVSVGLQKRLGAGIFGGAGLIFQKLAGTGTAWVQLAGELVEYDLAVGQSVLIHPGHLAMFGAEMSLEFATVKGIKNKIFGDSLFLAELHGPGRVWLQSMNVAKLAGAIQPYLSTSSSLSSIDSATSDLFGN